MKVGGNPRQAQRPLLCSLLIERRCWQLYKYNERQLLDKETWQGIRNNSYRLYDVWTGKEEGTTSKPLNALLQPHDVIMYRLKM